MKIKRNILTSVILAASMGVSLLAQVNNSGGVVRRNNDKSKKKTENAQGVTERMQSFYENRAPHEADLEFMREIYRELDLSRPENAPLYYPEDVIDGRENLFRVMLGGVVAGTIPAYEYLDGRELFTEQYKVKVAEMLDRYGIYYKNSGGNRKITIDEADVPTAQVLNYYIIEKWEFDRRSNRMTTRVEAICPVLTKAGDFGGSAKYPMFWVKYDALRPFLAKQYIFASDDNNVEQYNIDDYFTLGMYKGDIYKTKNLRNLSMAQMFPDEDTRKQAQDSIDNRLRSYGKNLWVPSREEYLAMKEKESRNAASIANGDSIPGRTVVSVAKPEVTKSSRRSTVKKTSAPKAVSTPKVKETTTSAVRSVRRNKR